MGLDGWRRCSLEEKEGKADKSGDPQTSGSPQDGTSPLVCWKLRLSFKEKEEGPPRGSALSRAVSWAVREGGVTASISTGHVASG